MKLKHHFWSSLAAGGLLYWATGSRSALLGTMIGGFAIDADHIVDQLWSIRHGAPLRRTAPPAGRFSGRAYWFLRPRKLLRLPLVLHSYELLAMILFLTFKLRTPLLIGLACGYVLHLALDFARHRHEFRSALFYLFSYRLAFGFRRNELIKPDYL